MSERTFSPNSSDEFPTLMTGDNNDDDAAVVASYVEPTFDAPEAVNTGLIVQEKIRPFSPTRMLTVTQSVPAGAAWQPFLLVPKDSKRRQLFIRAVVLSGVDTILLADDQAKLEFASACFPLAVGNLSVSMDNHTGPVWVKMVNASAATVSALAVSGGDDEEDMGSK